jgi:predicted nucleic acid-binding protein
MAASLVVDAGFLIALLSRRDRHHRWAAVQASQADPPWKTCDAALSEAFHLLGPAGRPGLLALVRRHAVVPAFSVADESPRVLDLMEKYADVPMSLADACLVRMSEVLPDPVILTTDADFRRYRRHSRHVIPCRMPSPTTEM